MKELEEKIRACGTVSPGGVLRVGGFLNHQIDTAFVSKLGAEFYRRFQNDGVNKILTVEASGIAVACLTAEHFRVPAVFAKKSASLNLGGEVYTAVVRSYTRGTTYEMRVEKPYLTGKDRVLIIDDFLAMGSALEGLVSLVRSAGASLAGAGIVIEKAFQPGGERLRAAGVRVESLARISRMTDDGAIEFAKEPPAALSSGVDGAAG